ncbi:MAG: protein-glutamate O-methyltransferase CheR [Aquabacterium sp.]
MIVQMDHGAVTQLRALVAQRLGLRFDDDKAEWLGSLLRKQAGNVMGADSQRYLHDLANSDLSCAAWQALVQELTVAETYFFRNTEQFQALREEVLPRRLAAQASPRALRCLSAGCASGEEAYSIVMTLVAGGLDIGTGLDVRALDLNPLNLIKARQGCYGEWSLRETTPEMRQRWFRLSGREHVLDERIRQTVRFEVRNLVDEDESFWQADHYDIIFCRNVLMYFTSEHLQAALSRITRSLAPGGYLFLGHAESLRGLSRDFHLRHTHSTFYYQRKTSDEMASDVADTRAPWRRAAVASGDWVQAIGSASDRVRALTASSTQPGLPLAGGRPAQPQAKAFERVFELFREERFNEALNMVEGLPADVARLPDMRLLHAVLLVHSGLLARAESLCQQLLREDELDANAHHLLSLCREGVGDHAGAIDSDRTAAYLDPAFAMPHLHLGLLARRQGDFNMVRKEFGLALRLLSREDATRLQLFGGGFNRQALSSLCAAELATGGVS